MSIGVDVVSVHLSHEPPQPLILIPPGKSEREVVGEHTRALLCIGLSKVPEQGHRVLTAGADGFARLWVRNCDQI